MDYWQKFEYENYYHVYNKSVSGVKLFKEDEDYNSFLIKFNKYLGSYINVYAYVLMPNHFHFLVKVKDEQTIKSVAKIEKTKRSDELIKDELHINDFIADQFKRWLSSYCISYKNKYGHVGSVLMNRFKRIESGSLEKNIYWLAYIHHNPIHHHYCQTYIEWRYSSYNSFIIQKSTKICKEEVFNEWFASKDDFLNYHQVFKLDKEGDIA
jgi:REP element-mobilizing transposase RayT